MDNTYLVVVLFALASAVSGEDTLLSVVQVFRHGDRTPLLFYPTDPYRDNTFWDGLGTGELTNAGKSQLNQLGKYFRDRYGDFVSSNYSEKEINTRTVSGNRNLQSAESFLKGLYPNQEDANNIPINETPIALMGTLILCLRYTTHWLSLELTDDYFKQINTDNLEDYQYISNHTVFPVYELMVGNMIYDTLKIEQNRNYTLPKWTKSVFPDKLKSISDSFAQSLCYDETLQRLGTGPFMHEIIRHFESVLSGGSSQKIQLFSVHDSNIACLLNTFEAFDKPHMPEFASSLIFELRKDKDGQSYVNTYYKPNEEAIPLNVRGCAFDCKLEEFKSVFSDIAISQLQWIGQCYTEL